MAPSVSVLTGFDCFWKRLVSYENTTEGASYQGGEGGGVGALLPQEIFKMQHLETLFPAFPGQFPRHVWSSLQFLF